MDFSASNPAPPLNGRRVLVTGASRGIGRGIARAMGAAGATLVLHARAPGHLDAVCAEWPDAVRVDGDLGTESGAERVARQTLEAAGGVDIVVNNAGIGVRGPLLETDYAAWCRAFSINVLAGAVLARRLVPGMIERRWGRVINVGSPYARRPSPGLAGYCVTKAALEMLTKSMALEWAGTGVTANAVAPIQVLTDLTRPTHDDPMRRALVDSQIPLGRWARPDDLDGVLLLLASPQSDMITGQTLFVDGGRLLV
jgi:NAD(P)-dependent dehydrogenase (short-subunit alcohol dehydrogenase family)